MGALHDGHVVARSPRRATRGDVVLATSSSIRDSSTTRPTSRRTRARPSATLALAAARGVDVLVEPPLDEMWPDYPGATPTTVLGARRGRRPRGRGPPGPLRRRGERRRQTLRRHRARVARTSARRTSSSSSVVRRMVARPRLRRRGRGLRDRARRRRPGAVESQRAPQPPTAATRALALSRALRAPQSAPGAGQRAARDACARRWSAPASTWPTPRSSTPTTFAPTRDDESGDAPGAGRGRRRRRAPDRQCAA